jgi:hypothetical protein
MKVTFPARIADCISPPYINNSQVYNQVTPDTTLGLSILGYVALTRPPTGVYLREEERKIETLFSISYPGN